MTKSSGKPESLTRRKRQRSTPVVEPEILKQLQSIESRLSELTDGQPLTVTSDDDGQFAGIKESLERQAESLHVLANGIQQFQQQVVADVVQAIQDAGLAKNESPDHVAHEPQVESSTEQENSEPLSQIVGTEPEAGSVDSSWAMIRQAMLESSSDESDCEQSVELVEVEELVVEEESLVESDENLGALEPLEFAVPAPFDSDTIDDESLRAEFLAREEIMRLMSVRLRQKVQPLPAISTEQLREIAVTLPDDLRQRTERSLGRLDEQLRLTELELSLERAKMAREFTRMEATRSAVECTARQMGYHITDAGTLETTSDVDDPRRSGRRWLRVLGFSR